MKKIVCVSLNPAIDKIIMLPVLKPGHLHRVESKNVKTSPGGKAINVAKVCNVLGADVHVIGFVAGDSGKIIDCELRKLGITTDFIWLEGETRTNLNIISGEGETEILETGPSASEDHLVCIMEKLNGLEADVIVFSGGLPPGLGTDTYFRLINVVKNALVILDTSGEALGEGLKAGPDLIKPNLRELSELVDQKLETKEEVLAASRKLLSSHKVATVVASMGFRGATLASAEAALAALPPPVAPVNTIGSGDSMVAGLAWGLCHGHPHAELLRLGLACAASNALHPEVGMVYLDEVKAFMEDVIKIEQL